MGRAEEKQDNGSLKGKWYREFIAALPKPEKEAVLLGHFTFQVLNGGFWQYMVNGYCVAIVELIEVVKQINDPDAQIILLMLVQIQPYVLKDAQQEEGFENAVIPAIHNEYHPFWDKLEFFSQQFFRFDQRWKQTVEAFLASQL